MLDDLFQSDDLSGASEEDDDVVIGIDLGTTNSVIGWVQNGVVDVIPDSEGHRLHPSVVAFTPAGERLVGLKARLRRIIDPTNTVYSAKRIIGQPFSSMAAQQAIRHVPYDVIAGGSDEPVVVTRAGHFPVPQISSFVLQYLKAVAEAHIGKPVGYCVITVPANFSDTQREATRQAAEIAGMEVLRVLNEPTAAALAYGKDRKLHQRIAVFDLGGGTFDVTVLAVREGLYEVIATGGDPFLGGDDVDQAIATHIGMLFLEEHRLDLRTDPKAWSKLLIAAEQIKMKLSDEHAVNGTLSDLAVGPGGKSLGIQFRFTRAELESLLAPLVDKAIHMCERVLAEAQLAPGSVDEVLLVGGSTRIPLVQARVTAYFGRPAKAKINPMEIVALGAGIHGQALFGGDAGVSAGVLMDVTSHALGVQTAGGYTEVLIAKNTTIPAEGNRVFATAKPGQTSVAIRVCQGADKRFDANVPVGELRLDGLTPPKAGKARVEVSFLIDADGILQVAARDPDSGRAERARLSLVGVTAERGEPPPL